MRIRPIRTRMSLPLVALVATLGVLVAVAVGSRFAPLGAGTSSPSVVVTAVDGPSEITAGSPLALEFAVEGAGEAPVVLAVGATSTQLNLPTKNGRATLTLAADQTTSAGVMTVSTAGPDSVLRHEVVVIPGSPAMIELFTDTSLLRAATPIHSSAIVRDVFGNLVADGTEVELSVASTLDSPATRFRASTSLGVADFALADLPAAQKLYLAASSGAAASEVRTVTRLAGPPTVASLSSIRLVDDAAVAVADGISSLPLTSDPIVDADGRLLADGTAIAITISGPDGAGVTTGRIDAGRLVATIPAPAEPGVLAATATHPEVVGRPLAIEFAPAVAPFELRSGEEKVLIGPVQLWNGALAPDGTFAVIDGERVPLVAGRAEVSLDPSQVGEVRISVLGVEGVWS